MHLAAAVGTPVVVPFGSTSPEMTGPAWSAGAQILRAPGIPVLPLFPARMSHRFPLHEGNPSEAVAAAALRALSFKS